MDSRSTFGSCFATTESENSRYIQKIVNTTKFREAIAWQNHTLLDTCVVPLARSWGRRLSRTRQHEEVVVGYLHRYCLKNETIGFFGPVGWAELIEHGSAIDISVGTKLLSARKVYFEQWAIDRIADRFSADPQLLRWGIPRRSPVATVRGWTARLPLLPVVSLTPDEARVFKACDGVRSVPDLVADLRFEIDHLMEILKSLSDKKLVLLGFEAPLDPHAELRLREALTKIADSALREQALNQLNCFESDRVAIAMATGNPDELHRALGRLDRDFSAFTGVSSNRSAGQMYVGRTLVYEDCQRDIAVRIGPHLLAALGPPLSLVLSSARWLTWKVGQHCRALFALLFQKLTEKCGSETIGFIEFYNYALNVLLKDATIPLFSDELRNRWISLLPSPAGEKSVVHTSASLREKVKRTFAAPGPGWPGARYHSPDLLVVGSSVQAINAGECQFVLGEIHIAANTLRGQFLVEQHPSAAKLLEDIDIDLPDIRLAPITPKRYATRATRIFPVLTSRRQYFAAMTLDSIPQKDTKTIGGSSLRVHRDNGTLKIKTTDGALTFDVLQAFSAALTRLVIDGFSVTGSHPHTPRVAIDSLVIARESWRFYDSDVLFLKDTYRDERFLSARAWRTMHDLPRWLFVRIPGEDKPIYMDFESPIAIDIVARKIRNRPPARAKEQVTFSEMLPRHGQHWLPDYNDRRYTGELRMVAVDQVVSAGTWPAQRASRV